MHYYIGGHKLSLW